MKILFTNHLPNRVGTLCMAKQPAEWINKINGCSAHYIPTQLLKKDMFFDIVVFAKQCDTNVLKWAKDKGMKTVWHSCDGMFYNFRDNVLNNEKYLDAIITTSDVYKNTVREIGFKTQILGNIFHHHCNFNNDIPSFREKVKKIGYIGCSDQLHNQEQLISYANKNNIEIAIRGDKDLRYNDLDVGLAYIDPNSNDYDNLANKEKSWQERINSRPCTKIVNYMAYGIPSVLTNYPSYILAEKKAKNCTYLVENFKEYMIKLDYLIKNTKARREMREACISNRDKFHISNISHDFVDFFNKVLENK